MSCFYCEKDERLHNLMLPLVSLQWSDVYLFRDQKHEGRVVVALKEHKTEIWQLDDDQRSGFFSEVSLVAEAVSKAFGADKINYAVYGDLVSHFHVHVVPKKKDGLEWGGPFTDLIEKRILSISEYEAVSRKLMEQLQSLSKV